MDQHTYNRAIVRERTDRYHAWLRFMGWPLVYPTLPLGLAAGPGTGSEARGASGRGLGALAGTLGSGAVRGHTQHATGGSGALHLCATGLGRILCDGAAAQGFFAAATCIRAR